MGYIEHWLHYKKFKKWQFLLFLLFSLPTGRSLKSHEIVCHGRLKCRRAVPKTYKEITWGHERWGVAKPRGLQFFSGQVFCWTWVALTVLTRNGGGGKLFNNHLYWHLRNGAIKKEVMGEKTSQGLENHCLYHPIHTASCHCLKRLRGASAQERQESSLIYST